MKVVGGLGFKTCAAETPTTQTHMALGEIMYHQLSGAWKLSNLAPIRGLNHLWHPPSLLDVSPRRRTFLILDLHPRQHSQVLSLMRAFHVFEKSLCFFQVGGGGTTGV